MVATRRVRRPRYVRVCQHCQGEITTLQAYCNYFYSLLCRKCFLRNPVA
ncbi:hypothetical protein KSC_046150 [Ktedonobacter sp. SOSP1-52]|nr:hypothetical protein [Ktedonobacter sp. SOSP1-52]GHO65723.1 hypothetical protein KSC_046150 [Ktedonobacter sp. SOSP1-52]